MGTLQEPVDTPAAASFLLCSDDVELARELAQRLTPFGAVTCVRAEADVLAVALRRVQPQLLFLDFLPVEGTTGVIRPQAATLAQCAALLAPAMPRIALGTMQQTNGMVAALRAGVSDFVDPQDGDELLAAVQRVLKGRGLAVASSAPASAGRLILLLGARPGLGCTTIATHWAGMVQAAQLQPADGAHGQAERWQHVLGLPADKRVALLDLGWPVGDAMLYLGQNGTFDFAEAAGNLGRLDRMLLDAAMAHDRMGVSLLPLPRDSRRMAGISRDDSLALAQRLTELFGTVLVDAGGLSDNVFLAALASLADEVCIVCDQSVGAVVSLDEMLRQLGDDGVVLDDRFSLVVNRHDAGNGLEPEQIAARFKLRLRGVLPQRVGALLLAQGQGQLLQESRPRDPWLAALKKLISVSIEAGGGQAGRGRSGWRGWLESLRTERQGHARVPSLFAAALPSGRRQDVRVGGREAAQVDESSRHGTTGAQKS